MELRQALRLKVGRKLAEVDRRKINLREVASALGVSERTLRNWRTNAKAGFKNLGRPKLRDEALCEARKVVFFLMEKHGSPGSRPIVAELRGQFPVRVIQRLVAEYKASQKTCTIVQRLKIEKKNVVWTLDGAFTKDGSEKIENQVIRDRGTLAWVGHEASKVASKADDVVRMVKKSGLQNGFPLVISTDNGAAYKSEAFREFLKERKVVHLRSLPRTPQHNGSVERGICELRQIMGAKNIDLKVALQCANERLRKFGKEWSTANLVYADKNVPYTELEREDFYQACARNIKTVHEIPCGARERRLLEREVILNELEVRGYLTRWKLEKNE